MTSKSPPSTHTLPSAVTSAACAVMATASSTSAHSRRRLQSRSMPDSPQLDLSGTALLVVDFQHDFFDPDGFLARHGAPLPDDASRERIVDNAAELIARFKVAGKPVV